MIDLISELSRIYPRSTTSSGGTIPCCVIQRKCLDDRGQVKPKIPKILPYGSFDKVVKAHQEWLRNTIHTFVAASKKKIIIKTRIINETKCDRYDASDVVIDNDDDIVIAYISGNSPDMLLSIIACTSSTLKPALPALLNIRWTPSEMIRSLESTKVRENDVAKTKRRHRYTIVLHDGTTLLENAANQVSNGLRQLEQDHMTCCLTIPSISHAYFVEQPLNQFIMQPKNDINSDDISLQQRMRIYEEKADKNDAIILFTSGTTGGSKGVRLSHRALLVQALAKNFEPCRYSTASSMLATTVPLFHVGGLSSFIAVLLAKGKLIFPVRDGDYSSNINTRPMFTKTNGKSSGFQVQDIPRSLRDIFLQANTLVVVPAMLVSFFSYLLVGSNNFHQQPSRYQFPKVRLILIGGQSISQMILQQARHIFPNARIVQTYACTEAASSLTFLSLTHNMSNKIAIKNENKYNKSFMKASVLIAGDCVGIAPNHVELRLYPGNITTSCQNTIVTIEGTKKLLPIVKPYELGLIATKGPHVMNGYWQRGAMENHLDCNKNTNQWFISNDLGFWDDQGLLYFGGRAKDVIRTGGETVLSQEVERVLQMVW